MQKLKFTIFFIFSSALLFAQPSNDLCTGAISLTLGASACFNPTQTLDNTNATDSGELPLPSCGGYNGFDLWFIIQVPSSGNVTVETSDDGSNTIIDTAISAYSGSCGALTELDCNDQNGIDDFSTLNLTNLSAGSSIYIRAWDWQGNDFGTFNICAYETPSTPSNDLCSGAAILPIGFSSCNNPD